ncbi:hypothetical protein B0H14DRAFT_2579293 [Mycena olivaceomarginata]|nr:hypothetical protein B0H14DRAFT_2579293 [Mycena olivaceomarginata]
MTVRSISQKNWWRRRKGSENELFLGAMVKQRRSRESMSTSLFIGPKPHQTARKSRQRRDRLRGTSGARGRPLRSEVHVEDGKGRATSKIHTKEGASSAEVYSSIRGEGGEGAGYSSNRCVQEDGLFEGSKRDLGRWGLDASGSAGISADTLKIFLGIILFLREVTQCEHGQALDNIFE